MILQLKAKHFKGTVFSLPCHCAIAKAMGEYLSLHSKKSVSIAEFMHFIELRFEGQEAQSYTHDTYEPEHFSVDARKAYEIGYNETVIREFNIPNFNLVVVQPVDTLIDNALKTKADDTKDKSPAPQEHCIY